MTDPVVLYFVDATTGAYIGTEYSTNPPPANSFQVPNGPDDGRMYWDFVNSVYYWPIPLLKSQLDSVRKTFQVQPLTISGRNVTVDAASLSIQSLISSEAASQIATAPRTYIDSSGNISSITNADWLVMYQAIQDHYQRCLDAEKSVSDAIDAKSVTLLSDVSGAFTTAYTYLVSHPITRTAISSITSEIQTALDGKVDKIIGKGLSTNDYTTAEQSKLAGIAAGATVQVNSDWNATSGISQVLNKPTLGKAYQNTTLRSNAFPIFKSGTVASGVVTFQLTSDGTSTGTSLFPNGYIDESINLFVNDATASYQMSGAFSNSNKTYTVTANKLSTASLLTGILGQAAANGATVKLTIWGY